MVQATDAQASYDPAKYSDEGSVGAIRKILRRKSVIAFIMTVPLILIIVGLVAYPSVYSIYLSMLNKKMTAFVGIDNFTFLLKRSTFQMIIFQTCFFAVVAVIFKA